MSLDIGKLEASNTGLGSSSLDFKISHEKIKLSKQNYVSDHVRLHCWVVFWLFTGF